MISILMLVFGIFIGYAIRPIRFALTGKDIPLVKKEEKNEQTKM